MADHDVIADPEPQLLNHPNFSRATIAELKAEIQAINNTTYTDAALLQVTYNDLIFILRSLYTAPAFDDQPENESVADPAPATFGPVTVTGDPTPTLQWQRAEAATPTVFVDVEGETSSSYTTAATVAGDDGDKVRCIATNHLGTATSNEVTLTVT